MLSRRKQLPQKTSRIRSRSGGNMEFSFVGLALIIGIGLIWFWISLYIIKEWERGVVLRLGRLLPQAKGAGLRLVFWPIETLYRITLHLETLHVPPHDLTTRDIC